MSQFLFCVALALVALTGCSRGQPATAVDATATNSLAEGDTAPPSPRDPGFLTDTSTAVVVVSDTGNVDATLEQLTTELRRYVIRTRTVPRNFEDFAAKSGLQAPPAPAGKKYAIKGQAITLVKR